jgi:hypothetical protein
VPDIHRFKTGDAVTLAWGLRDACICHG